MPKITLLAMVGPVTQAVYKKRSIKNVSPLPAACGEHDFGEAKKFELPSILSQP
jgi:hypothetical protein